MPKVTDRIKWRKAPDAPRRFKSSYMFYSTEKHKEIRKRLEAEGKTEKTTTIAKMVSESWKSLSLVERQPWEDMAKADKARYEMEKKAYTGPWKVPAKKRSTKDANAPKRPPSAFLAYSQVHRPAVRAEYPKCDNIEISRILAKRWKEAPQEEKQTFIDKEAVLRADYKVKMAEFRAIAEQKQAAEKEKREAATLERLKELGASIDNPSLVAAAAASSALAPSAAAQLRDIQTAALLSQASTASYPTASDHYGYTGSSSAYNPFSGSVMNDALVARAVAAAAVNREREDLARAYATTSTYGNPFSNTASLYQSTPVSSLARSVLESYGATGGYGGGGFAPAPLPSYNAYTQSLYARAAGLYGEQQLSGSGEGESK